MTLSEKIIAAHVGRDVRAGELVLTDVDMIYAHDLSGPLAISQLEAIGFKGFKYPDRVAFFLDHASPVSTRTAANDHRRIREFAGTHDLQFYDVGNGIAHQVAVEKLIKPGQIVIGGDSHTCHGGILCAFATGMGSTDVAMTMYLGRTWLKVPPSQRFYLHGVTPAGVYPKDMMLHIIGRISVAGATYKAMEFVGPVIDAMPVYHRMVFPNMSVEAGAKVGLVPSDARTQEYLTEQGRPDDFSEWVPDDDAEYQERYDIDVSDLEPQIACPHNVDNVKPVSDVGTVPVHQVYLGTCTNGRLEDFREAADILRGGKIARGVRLVATPASKDVYLRGSEEGIWNVIIEAGGVVNSPGCGACPGVQTGILADDENCLSTLNRNFKGRMGNPKANIYLASPATCAAGALAGEIVDVRKVMSNGQ
jgi:3-isopropylmalate/(R)-2-methylmalate dehydratase large subunit